MKCLRKMSHSTSQKVKLIKNRCGSDLMQNFMSIVVLFAMCASMYSCAAYNTAWSMALQPTILHQKKKVKNLDIQFSRIHIVVASGCVYQHHQSVSVASSVFNIFCIFFVFVWICSSAFDIEHHIINKAERKHKLLTIEYQFLFDRTYLPSHHYPQKRFLILGIEKFKCFDIFHAEGGYLTRVGENNISQRADRLNIIWKR